MLSFGTLDWTLFPLFCLCFFLLFLLQYARNQRLLSPGLSRVCSTAVVPHLLQIVTLNMSNMPLAPLISYLTLKRVFSIPAFDLLPVSDPPSQEWTVNKAYIHGRLLPARKVATKLRHPLTWARSELAESLDFMATSTSVHREALAADSSDALSSAAPSAQPRPSSS